MKNDHEKSDRLVVPAKSSNKAGPQTVAEEMEGRSLTKGNSKEQTTHRTQKAEYCVSQALDRVRQIAKSDKKMQFTNLLFHIYDVERLRASYFAMKRTASAGIDGETWQSYGQDLEANLLKLSAALKRGSYRAKPVRRVFIAKADGKQRPLGVPALEDKIVQRSVVEVMNAIYENDFCGFSYGYRPGRGQHKCLDALHVALQTRKVDWILDADIRGFFDNINHEWLIKFIEHRIRDKRVIRLIQKWLKAGVLTDGKMVESNDGVPQGGSISPLLANIYLHYALDLWIEQKRKLDKRGEMIIVRWADDFVIGLQDSCSRGAFLEELRQRLLKFELELHPDKTRVVEFGPFAIENRRRRGVGKPETFNFLGFTHICGVKWGNKRYRVYRRTIKKRMRAKLLEVKQELRRRMHHSIPEQGKWLRSVVDGHCRYYGVPGNMPCLLVFRHQVGNLWYRSLRRRSQNNRLGWEQMKRYLEKWIPSVKIHHPYPLTRMGRYNPR